jgi:Ser/Thr protein kinase RdoA (MazF antagonist)
MEYDNHQMNINNLLDQAYDIKNEAAIIPIGKGEWNRIYKIEAEPNLVLRISHRRKEQAQLAFELNMMTYVAESLQVVPRIRPTSAGELYIVQNGVLYTLFEYKNGRPISTDLDNVMKAGILLGRIHRVLLEYSRRCCFLNGISIIDFDWDDNYFFSGDVLSAAAEKEVISSSERKVLAKIIENISFLREAREKIERWINHYRRHKCFTESVIHGDYCNGNLLEEDKCITAVLDWDETATSWLEYEVANAMWEFSRDDTRFRIDPERKSLFLESYKSQNERVDPDDQSLTYLIAFRRLVEIHLDLHGLTHGEPYDLDYAYLNLLYLQNILRGSI